jgi:branched-chain amino acid transport system substrate-binding protein
MKKSLIVIIGLIVVVSIAIIGISVNPLFTLSESQSIKIGFIGPLTGNGSLWGEGSLDIVNLAIDEINTNGGINGKKLVVIAEDGKCNANDSVNAVNKLINVDNIKFILGGHCSSETSAIIPILNSNKVFGIAGVSTATGILDKSGYLIRTSPENKTQAQLVSKLAIEKYNIKSVVILTEQTVFAKSFVNDFKSTYLDLNGKIVSEIEFATNQDDLRTELTKLKTLSYDAVFISVQSPGTGINILKQMKELGINKKVFGNTAFVSKKVYDDTHGSLSSFAFTVTPYADLNSSKVNELNLKFKNKYGHDIPYNTFYVGAAYDGVYMLKEVLLKCGENPECVRDYFGKINYKGITANFSFDKHGNPLIDNWKELHIIDGKEVFTDIS